MQSFSKYVNKNDSQGSKISYPQFLMCPPLNLSADEPNNIFMQELSPEDRVINKDKAFNQFIQLYNYISSFAMIYLLPCTPGLQDQTFVANLGIVLPHLDYKVAVVSEFKSPPRVKEQIAGLEFFNQIGYDTIKAPKFFEGEADLKFFNKNNYIGAYGMRTSLNALEWFEQKFDCKIVKVEMNNPRCYHLDCLVYQLYENKCLCITSELSKQNIKEIEKFAEIIDVPASLIDSGPTNVVGLYKNMLSFSDIQELKVTDDRYAEERAKIDFLCKTCANHSIEPVFFNLSEFLKNGAALSCMILHLNMSRLKEE